MRYPVAQNVVHACFPAGTGGLEIGYHFGVVAHSHGQFGGVVLGAALFVANASRTAP